MTQNSLWTIYLMHGFSLGLTLTLWKKNWRVSSSAPTKLFDNQPKKNILDAENRVIFHVQLLTVEKYTKGCDGWVLGPWYTAVGHKRRIETEGKAKVVAGVFGGQIF